jgi:lysophospholipase L1-like esterase
MGPGGADEEARAFPAILAGELGAIDRLVVRGQGGDTAGDGRRRWQAAPIRGGIVLILYGSNDAALRGPLARRAATPISAYETDLAAMVGRAQEGGAVPVVLAPIPAGSAAMTRRLEPYRAASRRVAEATGAGFLDPAQAFARCDDAQPLLLRDALHLNRRGHACLGRWLAERLGGVGLVAPALDRDVAIGHAARP